MDPYTRKLRIARWTRARLQARRRLIQIQATPWTPDNAKFAQEPLSLYSLLEQIESLAKSGAEGNNRELLPAG